MKRTLFSASIAAALFATTTLANPFCSEMLQEESLEKKYQRLAPIYNSTETGWIFGSDQLYDGYGLKTTEQRLLSDIVAEFNARGIDLAMVVAPPRPVIAGQAILDQTAGGDVDFSVSTQAENFQSMIAQFNDAGAIAPDLLQLATSSSDIQENYYFKRDTHWTNAGAVNSALALAAVIDPATSPRIAPSEIEVVESFDERGSLSDIVRATCDVDPSGEATPIFDYGPYLPGGNDLLADTVDAETEVVLAGTSFSDRYKRDQYQFADALSASLGLSVENRSVSGGGMTGPLEAVILSGDLATASPELLVWEFPYTYKLRENHLRQILGALRAESAGSDFVSVPTSGEGSAVVPANSATVEQLGIRLPHTEADRVQLRLSLSDGSEKRLRLERKKRMQAVATLDTWWVDLSYIDSPVTTIEIEVTGGAPVDGFEVLIPNSSS